MIRAWTALSALFLIALLTTSKATSISSHSCNSSALSSASSNGVDTTDLSQAATSLKYCMLDNCTIMKIDTGEELEIIHATESLMVAVPTDGHTSEIVLKLENEVPCYTPRYRGSIMVIIGSQVTISLLHAIMNVYILTVHLLFAELRSVFGKLLMSYNAVLFLMQVFLMISVIAYSVVAVGSQVICQAILGTFLMLTMTFESYATCIMYYSYKCRAEIPTKNLFLFYNCFVFGLLVMFAAIIIGYDLYSGNGKQTISPNGHCVYYNQYMYQTEGIKDVQHFGNKAAQLSLFVIFLINSVTPFLLPKMAITKMSAQKCQSNWSGLQLRWAQLLESLALPFSGFSATNFQSHWWYSSAYSRVCGNGLLHVHPEDVKALS